MGDFAREQMSQLRRILISRRSKLPQGFLDEPVPELVSELVIDLILLQRKRLLRSKIAEHYFFHVLSMGFLEQFLNADLYKADRTLGRPVPYWTTLELLSGLGRAISKSLS